MTLITFEGGEGSGKGTTVSRLQSYLEGAGFSVVSFREPGSVPVAEELREVIMRPRDETVCDVTELFVYEAARAQFVQDALQPALGEYDVVLLDRFYDSTTAYQGYGRGLSLELIHDLNKCAANGVEPDLTFFLDVAPTVALQRVEGDEFSEDGDRFEQEEMEFHQRVRKGYQRLAEEYDRFVVVDAEENDADEVASVVTSVVMQYLES